jgi:hypothetical protein
MAIIRFRDCAVRSEHASLIRDRRICGVPNLIVEVLSPHNPAPDTVPYNHKEESRQIAVRYVV